LISEPVRKREGRKVEEARGSVWKFSKKYRSRSQRCWRPSKL